MQLPKELLEALALPNADQLQQVGIKVGKTYTDFGLPIDMALERLNIDKKQKLCVLFGAQNWLIQHRKNSNATDKALNRQRKTNREVLSSFIKTGEVGVY